MFGLPRAPIPSPGGSRGPSAGPARVRRISSEGPGIRRAREGASGSAN